MAGRKSDFVLPTKGLDDLFSTQEERDEAKLQKIRDIPLTEIDDFPDHPFQVREDEDMFQLVESDDFNGGEQFSTVADTSLGEGFCL